MTSPAKQQQASFDPKKKGADANSASKGRHWHAVNFTGSQNPTPPGGQRQMALDTIEGISG
jgi:hypothetical protein